MGALLSRFRSRAAEPSGARSTKPFPLGSSAVAPETAARNDSTNAAQGLPQQSIDPAHAQHPSAGMAAGDEDDDVSVLSLAPDEGSATQYVKPVDPARLDACHASFGVWFKLAAPYDLTPRQHQLLRLEVPGYASTLEYVVRWDFGPDEAFDALFKVVDPVHGPSAVARQWLSEDFWPGFWPGWGRAAQQHAAALIVASAVQRVGAQRKCRDVRLVAMQELEAQRQLHEDPAAVAKRAILNRKKMARSLASQLVSSTIRQCRLPGLATRVQALVRGRRARGRLGAYKAWLERRARFFLQQARSRAGLAALRAERSNPVWEGQIARRVWGREDFVPSGLRPNFKHADEYSLLDYVDSAPQGETYGARTFKTTLPLPDAWSRTKVAVDDDAWVGLPVALLESDPKLRKHIGPGPRDGGMARRPTQAAGEAAADALKKKRQAEAEAAGIKFVEEVDRGIGVKPHARFTHKHTWLPAPFLRDALSDVERYNANAKEGETAIRGRFIKNTTASATAGSRG